MAFEQTEGGFGWDLTNSPNNSEPKKSLTFSNTCLPNSVSRFSGVLMVRVYSSWLKVRILLRAFVGFPTVVRAQGFYG